MRMARSGSVSPPASSSTSDIGRPSSTSCTPGRLTAPLTVTSVVPGEFGVPAARYQSSPKRAISARCARVSTLDTSVGRPCSPFVGRPHPGRAGIAGVERVHQRGALARHEPGGHLGQLHLDRVAHPLGEGVGEHGGERAAGVQREHGLAGADGVRGERDAVQHEVRSAAQQRAVLRAGRVALAAVREHDRVLAALVGQRHLLGHRVARAAAAAQARPRHLLDEQALARAAGVVGEREGAEAGEVGVEVGGDPLLRGGREQPLRLDRGRADDRDRAGVDHGVEAGERGLEHGRWLSASSSAVIGPRPPRVGPSCRGGARAGGG